MFFFVTSLPVVICVFCVLISLVKIDPFNFYVEVAKKEMLSNYSVSAIQIIRIVIMILLSQWIAIGIKFCTILSLSMAASFQNIVNTVLIRKLSYSNILIYRQLVVERNILKCFEQNLTSLGLFAIFFILVVSINGTIIAWKFDKLVLFTMALVMFVFTLGLVVIGFHLCCSIYEISVKIQTVWASQLSTVPTYSKLLLRKLVVSCKVLSIPAGHVGIIDREIKVNFFRVTSDTAVNLLMST